MYKIKMLDSALDSLDENMTYLVRKLKNQAAARTMKAKINESLSRAGMFPYAAPAFNKVYKMRHEYRKLIVGSYIILYWVDEGRKTVMVEQIVYAGRDLDAYLKDES